jgi:hypothetical protein
MKDSMYLESWSTPVENMLKEGKNFLRSDLHGFIDDLWVSLSIDAEVGRCKQIFFIPNRIRKIVLHRPARLCVLRIGLSVVEPEEERRRIFPHSNFISTDQRYSWPRETSVIDGSLDP